MRKENWLLIIAIIIFLSGLVELWIVDLYAVVIAMICSWVTLMTWVIMRKLNSIR